jgi:hypothetical protein
MLFYREPKPDDKRNAQIENFFRKQRTPIDLEAEGIVESDGEQARTLGWLSLAYGAFIALGVLIPNTMGGRSVFLCIGCGMSAVGAVLLYAAARQTEKTKIPAKAKSPDLPFPEPEADA